ncbi:MAG: hypothetical protein ACI4KB_11735 [Oscillospiraceae bacterium]|nr:hypothetical protein [Oscillospiraceae bacterium]
MSLKMMNLASLLLESAAPLTGDTRNMKTPVIIAIVAVVLIVGCILLSGKSKNNDKK